MKKQRKTARQSTSIAGDLMLAPMVALMRLPLMAAEAGSGQTRRAETERAVHEKTSAIAEGVFAAQMSLIHSVTQFWPEVFSGRTPSILNGVAVERTVNAALRPASRRVKANFKRLSPLG
jgi:pantothenate kinase type III